MAKVKVEVLDAVVDGATKSEQIVIDERSAKHLESIEYVEIIGPVEDGEDDLSARTVDELKAIAKERGIEGFNKLRRDELIEAINASEQE